MLIWRKHPGSRISFHFRDKTDYIVLSSNGHLNVRSGQDDMFRAWGNSEFGGSKPQSVFEGIEKELTRINVTPSSDRDSFSFDSYGEFIDWLRL